MIKNPFKFYTGGPRTGAAYFDFIYISLRLLKDRETFKTYGLGLSLTILGRFFSLTFVPNRNPKKKLHYVLCGDDSEFLGYVGKQSDENKVRNRYVYFQSSTSIEANVPFNFTVLPSFHSRADKKELHEALYTAYEAQKSRKNKQTL